MLRWSVRGISDPFLQQNVRYHCPIFGIFKFNKPKPSKFKRKIWRYDLGDFDALRQKFETLDWETIIHSNIDIYTSTITSCITELSNQFIPTREVCINPLEPPWMNNSLKNLIRKRKRYYRKAKKTQSDLHWNKFRHIRNKIVLLIRESKKNLL